MTALGLPVYAVEQRVVGPNGCAHVVAVDQTVRIGNTAIAPDDQIVVDETGCVRIAAALADDVLNAARRYAAAEGRVAQALSEGEPLATAYRHKRSILDELRR